MEIVYAILKVFGLIALILFSLMVCYVVIATLNAVCKKGLFRRGRSFKRTLARMAWRIRKHRYISYVEFVKWVIIDLFRGKDKLRLFGIWCFTGYFGQGKTLGAVTFAKHLQRSYPHRNINIFTNFEMRGQAGKITAWENLLDLPRNSIVIFDEIQSTFTSQKFKEFPIELLWKITQCRKQGLMVFASTPVFHRMTIQLRENTDFVITCRNVLNMDRMFVYDYYRAPEFEKYQESPLKLFAHRVMRITNVAQDYDYRNYNTTQIVDRLDITGNDTNQNKKSEDKLIKQLQLQGHC